MNEINLICKELLDKTENKTVKWVEIPNNEARINNKDFGKLVNAFKLVVFSETHNNLFDVHLYSMYTPESSLYGVLNLRNGQECAEFKLQGNEVADELIILVNEQVEEAKNQILTNVYGYIKRLGKDFV